MANTPVLPVQGAQGSVPGQGIRSHMLQLKIPHAAMKTQCNQINILNGKKKKEFFTVLCTQQVLNIHWMDI